MDVDILNGRMSTFGNASSFSGPTTPSNSSSRASSSSGSSRTALSPGNTECSNCKLLSMKIKILKARLAMEKNPDDHPCESAAILHELLNEMENLRMEYRKVMSTDKSWTRPTLNRNSPKFKLGLNDFYERGYPTWVQHVEPRIIPPPIVDDTNDMINVLNDVHRENNYIEPEPNTEHNTNTASTSNAPPEAAGPTKDDMEGLFEMANEELFPTCTWMSSLDFLAKFAHLKDNKDEEICPTCKTSRWKNKDTTGKKVPNKVLHYFPLIPRLKRMYGSLHTAKHMTWHATRNVPKMPLVKELKTLWKKPGVKTLDVATNTEFLMRAMLLWTISDFPARSSLSGWSGQGYLACPTCNEETPSTRVNGKTAYVGHRRFLPIKHRWRNNKTFNGKSESRPKPKKLTSAKILKQLADVPSRIPGKHPSYGGVKRQRDPIVEKN
ncbi:RNA-directed DNA polymerase, eukaryota, reverse transcriptase zinc-binding domain protein [Tanacetum coccineum]